MLSDDEFRQLLDFLDRPWAGFRKVRKGVKKRVRRHMEQLECSTLKRYLSIIESDPLARVACEQCLRVTISRFFRDKGLWENLERRLLPEIMDRFPDSVKIWSAGCANGEEAYTLAMVLEELASPHQAAPRLEILATDADAACLQRARAGQYPLSSLKELPEALKKRWFHKVPGTRQWHIDPLLQKHIEWQTHNLLDPQPRRGFQLIFLRNNLLTYYQGVVMKNALEQVIAAMKTGGILIVGSHERLPTTDFPLKRDFICPWVYYAT
jgi:chemotaxis methyl-accepting protein methylase